MEALTPWHLALILVGFVLLFGYKRLPDASRSLGRSLRIFKSEMRELSDDGRPGSHPDRDESAEELERQALQAEAEARALRARVDATGT